MRGVGMPCREAKIQPEFATLAECLRTFEKLPRTTGTVRLVVHIGVWSNGMTPGCYPER